MKTKRNFIEDDLVTKESEEKHKRKVPTEEEQEEYSKFVGKQFQILKGHFDRCMLRCFNKYHSFFGE